MGEPRCKSSPSPPEGDILSESRHPCGAILVLMPLRNQPSNVAYFRKHAYSRQNIATPFFGVGELIPQTFPGSRERRSLLVEPLRKHPLHDITLCPFAATGLVTGNPSSLPWLTKKGVLFVLQLLVVSNRDLIGIGRILNRPVL